MAKKKDYLGLSRLVSLILAIIPVTSWILGIITRIKEGSLIGSILRIIPATGVVIWVVDLILMITSGKIWRVF